MADRGSGASWAAASEVMPGVWRLRLPLPWPGVPHVNAFAVAADGGIVLFDTGMATDDGLRQLELALAQAGFGLEDVRLLVCTHSHTDHYGLAGPIVDRAGCELWMHPAWGHVRAMVEDPDRALDRRIEVARQSGVPAAALERLRGIAARPEPGDRARRRARPRPGPRGRGRTPTSARGRCTRRPGTRPPTSPCTSPTAAC